jgi:hypothetical protein
MAVLLITYDLNSPGQNYKPVLDFIKSHDAWARLSESCYAVRTEAGPAAVRDAIRAHMDPSDYVYVITLKQPYSGFGPVKVNEWLDSNLTY